MSWVRRLVLSWKFGALWKELRLGPSHPIDSPLIRVSNAHIRSKNMFGKRCGFSFPRQMLGLVRGGTKFGKMVPGLKNHPQPSTWACERTEWNMKFSDHGMYINKNVGAFRFRCIFEKTYDAYDMCTVHMTMCSELMSFHKLPKITLCCMHWLVRSNIVVLLATHSFHLDVTHMKPLAKIARDVRFLSVPAALL